MFKIRLVNLVLSAILIFPFAISAQEKINQFDANGKRIGVWKKYHTNNRIRYQGQFEAGKEVGVFKFYSPLKSDHPISIRTYQKDSDIAKVQFFSVDGVLESAGAMQGKNRVGTWNYYHKDGKTLLSDENYKDGMLHGKSSTYYKTGALTEVLNYENNELSGIALRYDSNGTIISEVTYKKGKLNGWAKYYTPEGKMKYQGAYENDEKVGDWEYFENGKSKKVDKSE